MAAHRSHGLPAVLTINALTFLACFVFRVAKAAWSTGWPTNEAQVGEPWPR